MIPADDFCTHYKIEHSFIELLKESALIETVTVHEQVFIDEAQLPLLEKLVRLHVDLGINVEGLETILHMQERMQKMQLQITQLQNALRRWENQ